MKKIKNLNILDNLETQEKVEWTKLNIISSGRFSLWEKAFIYIKKRPFLGYGSMSDRHKLMKKA